jgi:hypothetical protein
MLWPGCYRNPAQKGTFLSSYHGDILMEFRQNGKFLLTREKQRIKIPFKKRIAEKRSFLFFWHKAEKKKAL